MDGSDTDGSPMKPRSGKRRVIDGKDDFDGGLFSDDDDDDFVKPAATKKKTKTSWKKAKKGRPVTREEQEAIDRYIGDHASLNVSAISELEPSARGILTGDEHDGWWWKFFHDVYPNEEPNENLLHIKTFETCGLYEIMLREPVLMTQKTEYRLKVELPTINWRYGGTKHFSHPDPACRFDPKVNVTDFDNVLAENHYYKDYLDAKKFIFNDNEIVKSIEASQVPGFVDAEGNFKELHPPNIIRNIDLTLFEVYTMSVPSYALKYQVFLRLDKFKALSKSKQAKVCDTFVDSGFIDRLRRSCNENTFRIPNSLSSPEIEPANGFGLQLRPYQKRTLSWIINLEKMDSKERFHLPPLDFTIPHQDPDEDGFYTYLRIGPTNVYFDISTKGISYTPPVKPFRSAYHCQGGVLADDTGTGKTVTVLALIHSQPFQSMPFNMMQLCKRQPLEYLPSRATLVVCPSHLALQWKMEAERCMPNSRVHLLTTIYDHKKLSWNDVMFADIVIVTLFFLQNLTYSSRIASMLMDAKCHTSGEFIKTLHAQGREKFGNVTGQVILDQIIWHRICADEFHELGKTKKLRKASIRFSNDLRGAFYLGVTGTPQIGSTAAISSMFEYLDAELPRSTIACRRFLKYAVRRNEPNLELPPLRQRCIYVEMTPHERGLYHGMEGSRTDALMACNHHQLADAILDMVGTGDEMSIEEVSRAVQDRRLEQIEELGEDIERLSKHMQSLQQDVQKFTAMYQRGIKEYKVKDTVRRVADLIRDRQASVLVAQRNIAETAHRQREIQSQYNFFKAVLDAMRTDEEVSCLICLDTIEQDETFAIAKCGHLHCVGCINQLLNQAEPKCSFCRQPIGRDSVMQMNRKQLEPKQSDPNGEEKEKVEDAADCSKYGSKLAAFVGFLRQTFRESPNSKVILFIQFRRLMRLVSEALHEFQVPHVRCDGNVNQRSTAIHQFRKQPDVRLILLSSEDSVSGLHLVEATHVVLLHPFLMADDALAVSYEKQGIARAWRSGLDHPVELIRFIVRDSIEEELSARRGYKNGVLTTLDGDVQEA